MNDPKVDLSRCLFKAGEFPGVNLGFKAADEVGNLGNTPAIHSEVTALV